MSCSEEEIANVETSSRNAIGFNVLSNAAETRATPTTPSNLTRTDFDVFAFTADGTAFMGKVDTEYGHDGVNIVYKSRYKSRFICQCYKKKSRPPYLYGIGGLSV